MKRLLPYPLTAMTKRVMPLLLVAVTTSLWASPAAGVWELRLEQFLQRDDAAQRHTDLPVELCASNGVWRSPIIAFAPEYNFTLHRGELISATNNGVDWSIELALQLGRGGPGYEMPGREGSVRCAVTLKAAGDEWRGDYSASFGETLQGRPRSLGRTYEAQGRASLRRLPNWPPRVAGFIPPKPGEHPRLFFRQSDIPMLRERAQTPEGRRIVERLQQQLKLDAEGFRWGSETHVKWAAPYTEGSSALGHAFAYVLTGDAAAAARARELTRLALRRNDGEWGGWGIALRIAHAAIAYDLCYEAWDAAFRQECQEMFASSILGREGDVTRQDRLMFATAGGMAALAILDDPVPEPPKPPARSGARPLALPIALTVPERAPVSRFASGQVPKHWLVAAGHAGSIRPSLLPNTGEKIPSGFPDLAVEFKPYTVPTNGNRLDLYGLRQSLPIPLGARCERGQPVFAWFFTLLALDHPQVVLARPNSPGAFFGPDRPLSPIGRPTVTCICN